MTGPAVERVCVVIGRTRHKMMIAELGEAAARGWPFIELRLDFLKNAVEFKRLSPLKQGPWIATLRRPAEGGRFAGNEEQRLAILRQAIVAGCFEYVDLETDIAATIRRFGQVKRIVSYHNLSETPADLEQIYERMLGQDADIVKIAVMPNTPADVSRILKLQRAAKKPTVAFTLGDLGFFTRFTALKFGAPFTYAAFNTERTLAPGMPTVRDIKTIYPVRGVDADTAFFGVLGDPVVHSLSPVVHNHMLLRSRTNALYVPLRVPEEHFAGMMDVFGEVPFSGFSVTIPHKEAAAELGKADADAFTETAHAANTLLRKHDGSFAAYNTDYVAAVESLKHYLSMHPREDGTTPGLDQMAVLILGSGGVARAIAHGLHARGAQLTIAGRTEESHKKLAAEVHCKSIDWQGRHNVRCDILINCTPIGMHPRVDESPVHHSFLQPGMIVFDTVYNPETTMLLREAQARGCGTISGVEMFVRQAARQFEIFTSKVADIDRMRTVMRKAMSPIPRALEEEAEDAAA